MKRMGIAVVWALCLSLFGTGYAFAGPAQDIKDAEAASEAVSGSDDEIVIRMVGDDLIHKPIYEQSRLGDGTYQFDKIFAPMKEDFESADVAILNQETIFVRDYSKVSTYPMFGSPDALGHAIAGAGFDVVAHATNHAMDKGVTGIEDTIGFWEANYPEILYLGIHKDGADSDIRYLTVKDLRIAFVNYTYGLNGLEKWRRGREYLVDLLSDPDIQNTMQTARENSDLQIAILHAGNEYVHEPTAYQRQQIHRFLDLGADIVFCAHPHVLQPYQMVTTASGNTGLVYYSLGNYISAQGRIDCILGGMAEVRVRKREDGAAEIADYSLIPLITHQEGGNFVTYKLSDYPEGMESRHELLQKTGFPLQALWELFGRVAPRL